MEKVFSNMSVGERIFYLITLAGMRVKGFCEQSLIPQPTLYAWTSGRNTLNTKRLMIALYNAGVVCSKEWIERGTGFPPHRENKSYFDTESCFSKALHNQELKRMQEAEFFKRTYENSLLFTINSDGMEPNLTAGDFVGGKILEKKSQKNLSFLHGKIVIAVVQEKTYVRLFRWAEDVELILTNPFCTTAEKTLVNPEISMIAPVIWIRKKDLTLPNEEFKSFSLCAK